MQRRGATAVKAPEITVIIPTRSRWPLLARALAGALAQEDVDLEVVVVDDGSTDETPARLAALGDPRVVTIRHDRARGVARARNAAIARARGEWLAFLDDDDVWSPRKLRLQLDAALRTGASYAYGGAIVFDDVDHVRHVVPAPAPDAVAREIAARNLIPGGCSNVIARTDVVRAADGFDEELATLADWDLWIRLARLGAGARSSEVVVGYRRHPDSMVIRGEQKVLDELERLRRKHRDLTGDDGAEPRRDHVLRYFARAERRGGRRRRAARLYLLAAREGDVAANLLRALVVLLGPHRAISAARLRHRAGASAAVRAPEWLVERR